jgi:hypothetical protein
VAYFNHLTANVSSIFMVNYNCRMFHMGNLKCQQIIGQVSFTDNAQTEDMFGLGTGLKASKLLLCQYHRN